MINNLNNMKREDFIKKCNKDYNYDLLPDIINVNNLLTIICPVHGEFKQRGNSHLKGSSCKKCYEDKRNLKESDFISICNQKHGYKYLYEKIGFKSIKKNITITCPIHGDFEQLASRHIKGQGCRKCSDDSRRLNVEDFIKRSNLVHNNKYSYDNMTYLNSQTKIDILCKEHGYFKQTPNNHLIQKKGCPKCNGGFKYTIDDFLTKSIKKHKNKYQYFLDDFDFNKKILITCDIGHVFNQLPSAHLRGQGCPVCKKMNSKYTNDEFVAKSNSVHNFMYEYLEKYNGSNNEINILCKRCNNVFSQKPRNHIGGNGCPVCCSNVSKMENKWLDMLNIDIKSRHKSIKIDNKNYFVDAVVDNNIYEFYGDYWHGNLNKYNPEDINKNNKIKFKDLNKKTIERENILIINGYNVISIWESDFKKILKNEKFKN